MISARTFHAFLALQDALESDKADCKSPAQALAYEDALSRVKADSESLAETLAWTGDEALYQAIHTALNKMDDMIDAILEAEAITKARRMESDEREAMYLYMTDTRAATNELIKALEAARDVHLDVYNR